MISLSRPIFVPKKNVLNIQSDKDIFDRLDEICNHEKEYTDNELADKINLISDFCCGGESGYDFWMVHHRRSEELVESRVKKYCRKHRIKREEYNGPLPYRMFVVEVMPNKIKDRRLKIEQLMKIQKRKNFFNNIKSIWKNILGTVR